MSYYTTLNIINENLILPKDFFGINTNDPEPEKDKIINELNQKLFTKEITLKEMETLEKINKDNTKYIKNKNRYGYDILFKTNKNIVEHNDKGLFLYINNNFYMNTPNDFAELALTDKGFVFVKYGNLYSNNGSVQKIYENLWTTFQSDAYAFVDNNEEGGECERFVYRNGIKLKVIPKYFVEKTNEEL